MKGKISKSGWLVIERSGKWINQYCPFVDDASAVGECAHFCPLFAEPETEELIAGQPKTLLRLCHRTLTFDELIDERGEKK